MKLWEGYVFTPVCDSVHRRGGVSQHASQVTWADTPWADTSPGQTPPDGQ